MIIGEIDTNDISIIVQGPVNHKTGSTKKCLDSIRKYFPGSEIIFSTESSDLTGLDFDILVLNEDVGPDILPRSTFRLNLKRQIYSTQQGLKKATKKYILKVRSDIEFLDSKFLKFFNIFSKTDKNYKIFNHRIIVPMIQHSYKTDFLFFPSDWLYFGLAEDIKNLFNISYNTDENNQYLINNTPANQSRYNDLPEEKRNIHTQQYWSEQYIFFKCLLNNGVKLDFRDWTDTTPENRLESEKYLINNFIVCDDSVYLNIKHNKIPNYSDKNLKLVMSSSYTLREFMLLYKKYCDKNFKIPFKYIDFKQYFCIQLEFEKLKKNLKYFFYPFLTIFNWLIRPIKVLKYTIIIFLKIIIGFAKILK